MTSERSIHPDRATAAITVDLDASPDAVWRALTTGDGLAWWMGEGSRIDPRVGGEVDVADVVGGRPRRGQVTEVVPRRLLSFDWWPADRSGPASTVAVRIEATEDGTRVSVTESIAIGGRSADGAGAGALASSRRRSVVAPGFRIPRSPITRPSGPTLQAGHLRSGWMWRLALVSLATTMCGAVR